MAVFRQVHVSFWQDARVVEEMTPEDRYFYLYLLTNPNTTQIGIYPITKKQMAFELGYSSESVNALLERFENHHNLIKYNLETREIAILNWGKYNFTRGGKPVEDCVKKELQQVKDKELIALVAERVTNPTIKKIYEDFYLTNEVYMSPSKLFKPGLGDRITTRDYVIWRDRQTCFYTGKVLQLKDIEIDHIIPESEGGRGTPDNLVVSWKKFNQFKSGNGELVRVCALWNAQNPHDPVDYGRIKEKIEALKAFEQERWERGITYREAIENGIYDTLTLRIRLDTIRGQEEEKEQEKEQEQEKEKESNTPENGQREKENLCSLEDIEDFVESHMASNPLPVNKKLLVKYIDCLRLTRKTARISTKIIKTEWEKWAKFPQSVITYAMWTHVEKHDDKREEYTLGIMRRTTESEANKGLKQLLSKANSSKEVAPALETAKLPVALQNQEQASNEPQEDKAGRQEDIRAKLRMMQERLAKVAQAKELP